MSNDKNQYDFSRRSPRGTKGFEAFRDEDSGKYFFHVNGPDGEPILYSQAYASASDRDIGMRSVKENSKNPERYGIKTLEDGSLAIVLRANNRREIARSHSFDSMEDAGENLRLLLDIIHESDEPATEETANPAAASVEAKTTAPEAAVEAAESLVAVEEAPRYYFDLRFYNDGFGVISYPASRESARFEGLNGPVILSFLEKKLPHTFSLGQASKPQQAGFRPVVSMEKKGIPLPVRLSKMSLRRDELGKGQTVEAQVDLSPVPSNMSGAAPQFFLKSLKDGEVLQLGQQQVEMTGANASSGSLWLPIPEIEPGMYRLLASVGGQVDAESVDGWPFRVF